MKALLVPSIWLTLSFPAVAEQAMVQTHPCDAWVSTVVMLKEKYGEEPVGRGQGGPDSVVTLFASPNGATFSIVVVYPSGMSCLVAMGSDWEQGPILKGEPM